ncbi:MAG TPA: DUF1800 domain-containing protein [Pyrinomonadaceae bacterium]|jgi:uncharacterized protein (DUF1800 family)
MRKNFSLIHRFTSLLMIFAIFSPISTLAKLDGQKNKAKSLTEDQKILHVLNRLGFGARPGDVEKVKAIGINKYIEQQLNPASINDSVADAKVKNLNVLQMSNEELFAKYPNPAAVLQVVAQNNGLDRQDLQAIRQKNQANADEMKDDKNPEKNSNEISDADRQKYQREVADLYQKYNLGRPQQIMQQLNASRIMRAVYSERQLQEVMVDFWSNHFNVYAQKAATRWFLPEYDRDVIRPNALGNFKDLLLATAKSPAMLFYLDNFESISPNATQNLVAQGNRRAQRIQEMLRSGNITPQIRQQIKDEYGVTDEQIDKRLKQMNNQQRQKRGINENYAREIMELHTLGVDGGYTQKDIQEVARAFTGWTIVDARGYRRAFTSMAAGDTNKRGDRLMRQAGIPTDTPSGTFYFNPRWHDDGDKTILGQKVSEGGMKDGLRVIDILANHPSTAKFIARKLAVKFVSDNPSEALVKRVADAFLKSKGDIKTTLRALFTDEEFFSAENYRAKIKTPFELAVSALRTLGADTNGGQIQAMLAKMGEQLYGYQAPTGYPDTAEDWVNTGALLERMNFAVALAANQIPGTRVDLKKFEAKDKSQILEHSIADVLEGEINPNTRATLLKQIEQPLPATKLDASEDEEMPDAPQMANAQGGGRNRLNRQNRLLPPSGNAEVFKVVGLILGSPDFQRQ